jgi:hypothetical protein
MFASVRDAVATVLDPRTIRWIGFSHVEADECGSLPEWQALAPQSTAVCSLVGKMVSVDDCMATRPALGMQDGEVLTTGKYRFRFLHTPHVPHCWEAGMLFEETQRTLLCSDLFHQAGDVEPSTQADVIGRCRQVLVEYQQGPLANYMPYSTLTDPTIQRRRPCSRKPWRRCMAPPSSATAPARSATWRSCLKRCWARNRRICSLGSLARQARLEAHRAIGYSGQTCLLFLTCGLRYTSDRRSSPHVQDSPHSSSRVRRSLRRRADRFRAIAVGPDRGDR